MKFICTKENLSHALDLVSGIAAKHTNLPILSNILISVKESRVELIATNLEMAVKVNLRAKVESDGIFTVPSKTLTDYIHLLSNEQIEIELVGNELMVKCGSSETKIKGTVAEEFPLVPEVEEKFAYVVDAQEYKKSLSEVVFAAARNEIRPELSGVYFGFFTERFEGLVVAATDSYRLAEYRTTLDQGSENIKVIVPSRTVYEMIRILSLSKDIQQAEKNIRLWVSENQIAIRYDNFELTSRLVDGKYPDYAQIIPASFKTDAIFPISVLENKIKAAGLFTTTGVNAVSFSFDPSNHTIKVSSTSTQTGEHVSDMEAEVTGEKNQILLNHRYVLEGLQNMNSETSRFRLNSADSPCLIEPKDGGKYLYIVMPIRQ
ncbi:MAG TPA: DNA polymerase III subunit beta [Candidatus Magasanikbacteria bacterium]|nr:DNA polymerase III subunit beta [Candidatus Magasanikbacteria bacterium]